MTEIFHTSTLRQLAFVSPTGETEHDNDRVILLAGTVSDEDAFSPLWDKVLMKLNTEELETLNNLLQDRKKVGRKTNECLRRERNLKERIKGIVLKIKDDEKFD